MQVTKTPRKAKPAPVAPAAVTTRDDVTTPLRRARATTNVPKNTGAASWSRWVDVLAPRGPLALLEPHDVDAEVARLQARGVAMQVIGQSQQGRPIHAAVVGHGPVHLTVMAAAHADEPVGTLTCLQLIERLALDPSCAALASCVTLHVVPCANPDGAVKNAPWLSSWGTPRALEAYFTHVSRDLAAADVEFGFPTAPHGNARVENQALAHFFDAARDAAVGDAQAGIAGHTSLHSMFLGGGALFLVTADGVREPNNPHSEKLRFLLDESARAGLALHDKDRMGQKGFFRIGAGLQTAPTAEAMSAFFGGGGFALNSMQYVAKHGACPFAIVSEIPLVYDARISSNAPAGISRAAEEERFARALLTMAQGVRTLAASAKIADGTLGNRLAAIESTASASLNDLSRYGDMPATEGNIVENDLNLLRREATLLAAIADGNPAIAQRFSAVVEAITTGFALKFPSLEVQVRLQIAAVLASVQGSVFAPLPATTLP